MPGGSVNGRPFRESRDSYQKTGIPCGNPKRYQSTDVVRMPRSDQESTKMAKGRVPLSGPVEDIETEGQRQLKQMVHKQLKTKVTLQEHLKTSRTFSGGTAFKARTDELSGVSSLSKFKSMEQEDIYLYELKQCGLTEDEIDLKRKLDKNITHSKGRYGIDPLVNQDKLNEIERKINARKEKLSAPDTFHGQKEISRHEMDLEKTLIQDNKQTTKLTTALLKESKGNEFLHPDHPMNHLPEILETVTKIEKGKKRKANDGVEENIGYCDTSSNFQVTPELGTRDIRDVCRTESEMSIVSHTIITPQENPTSSGLPKVSEHIGPDSQVSESKHRRIYGNVTSIPEDDIISNRLELQEIRRLPRFQNYEPGIPSKVLYLKNLSNKVIEEDLVSLFLRFQDQEKIVFRLLTGRMKGQAFITFHDVEKAKAALDLVNGYDLKGKPVIIQFGKNTE